MNSHDPQGGTRAGDVLSLGSINADFQVRVERRPQVSETLVGHDYARLAGGKAANVAYLCARLGLDSLLFGHVGADDLADQALRPLHEIGVDLSGVSRLKGQHTGMAMIAVPPDGRKGIILAPNANDAPWTDEDHRGFDAAVGSAARNSIVVADGEMDIEALDRCLRKARDAGLRIVLDPSPAERIERALLELSDFIVPNAGEARALTGLEVQDPRSAARAAHRLCSMGAAAACVKLSAGGCVFADGNQLLHVHSLEVDVVDTTGAGDAFAGALAAGLARGQGALDAVRLAVAASQYAVTGYGSQPAYPRWEELETLARQLDVSTLAD